VQSQSAGRQRMTEPRIRAVRQVHIFGFTAHERSSEIGAILEGDSAKWARFRIRFSSAEGRRSATVMDDPPWGRYDAGITCPAGPNHPNISCGTCAPCVTSQEDVVFGAHGRSGVASLTPCRHSARRASIEFADHLEEALADGWWAVGASAAGRPNLIAADTILPRRKPECRWASRTCSMTTCSTPRIVHRVMTTARLSRMIPTGIRPRESAGGRHRVSAEAGIFVEPLISRESTSQVFANNVYARPEPVRPANKIESLD